MAIGVEIGHWLLIVTLLLALFLALSKRRHELVLLAEGATHHRRILQEYSPYLLDQMIAVVTASALVSYVIYTVSPETVAKFNTHYLGLTLVVAGTLAILIGAWNYWTINRYLESSPVALPISRSLKLRWMYAYVLSAVLVGIGVVTFLFMVRVI